jgi:mono/diheme cytochrome c family protein
MASIGRIGLSTFALAASLSAPVVFAAQDTPTYDSSAVLMGSSTFKTYCAACHGRTAQGDGPLADQLRFAPADLTRISRRNGGKFPSDNVYRIIDGREAVKTHGGTDMPVWGDAFLESREGYSPEKVREKITELVHFLASIQE